MSHYVVILSRNPQSFLMRPGTTYHRRSADRFDSAEHADKALAALRSRFKLPFPEGEIALVVAPRDVPTESTGKSSNYIIADDIE